MKNPTNFENAEFIFTLKTHFKQFKLIILEKIVSLHSNEKEKIYNN